MNLACGAERIWLEFGPRVSRSNVLCPNGNTWSSGIWLVSSRCGGDEFNGGLSAARP
jgi:hypothetical protein